MKKTKVPGVFGPDQFRCKKDKYREFKQTPEFPAFKVIAETMTLAHATGADKLPATSSRASSSPSSSSQLELAPIAHITSTRVAVDHEMQQSL